MALRKKPHPRPRVQMNRPGATLVGYSQIAPAYWATARDLHEQIRKIVSTKPDSFMPHSVACYPAIITYHACVECFLNEEAAYSTMRGTQDDINHALLLQDASFMEKISIIPQFYEFAEFSASSIESIKKFAKLRNLIYHHSPQALSTDIYPEIIRDLIEELDLPQLNCSWISYVGNLHVLDWAGGTVASYIKEFDRCAKRESSISQWERMHAPLTGIPLAKLSRPPHRERP